MQRAVAESARALGQPWLPAVCLAALLALYNNVLFALPDEFAAPPAWIFFPRSLLVPALVVAWALRFCRLSLADLGLATRKLALGTGVGLAAAAIVTLPVALFLLLPIGPSEGSIDYGKAAEDGVGDFLYWALIRYPLNAAIFEEVLFRGVLQALAIRAFGLVRGIGLTAGTFSLWHVVVDYETMGDTDVADSVPLFVFAQAGALVALFAGGVIFALMRLRPGSLAAPITFHWLAVVGLSAAPFALSR